MRLFLGAITWGRKVTAVLVVCAFLSSSAFAEVLHGEILISTVWFDLETGTNFLECSNRRCPPNFLDFDFKFYLITDLPQMLHQTGTEAGVRRIATFDKQPFETVGDADVDTAMFSTDPVDFPMEGNDTVILQTDTGAYYKVGNVVYSNVTGLVNFDYEELTSEIDADRVFRDSFEGP